MEDFIRQLQDLRYLDSVRKFDILEDRAVNNFVGSRSLEYNLQLIPKGNKFFMVS